LSITKRVHVRATKPKYKKKTTIYSVAKEAKKQDHSYTILSLSVAAALLPATTPHWKPKSTA
jgi:hypothetical protein